RPRRGGELASKIRLRRRVRISLAEGIVRERHPRPLRPRLRHVPPPLRQRLRERPRRDKHARELESHQQQKHFKPRHPPAGRVTTIDRPVTHPSHVAPNSSQRQSRRGKYVRVLPPSLP